MAEMMFVVEKDGDNAILRSSQCPDFASFVAAVRGKFTDLQSDDFPLKFILEPNQLSSVKSQQDFENVILLCQSLDRRVAKLTIIGYVSTGNSGTKSLSTTRKENTLTEEQNEGECAASPAPISEASPQDESRSPGNALTEKQNPERNLPEEERNEGECETHSIPLSDVALHHNSRPPLNAPAGKGNFRNIPMEGMHVDGCLTRPRQLYDVALQHDSRSPLNAPAEKQNFWNIPMEGRNVDGCLTRPRQLINTTPQQNGNSLRNADWADRIKHVGQEFRGGVKDFRHQLAEYATKRRFNYKYERNDSKYIHVYCSKRDIEGCQWFINGGLDTINRLSFVIRRANLVHTCTPLMGNGSSRLSKNIMGNLLEEKVRSRPKISARQVKDEFLREYGLDMTYMQVWRGVEEAKGNIYGFGNYKDTYKELHWYKDAIMRTNPGSHVTLETEEGTNRFKRFFLAFKGSLHGFKKCRPILFVDATSSKRRFKEIHLSAIAKDGNNGIFPVAFAIVDVENGNNWIWFLSKLRDVIEHDKEIMYLSDRAGGLLAAFNMVWERPLHFFCLYHLMKYLRGMYTGQKYSEVFKNKMCKLLKDAAYAPTPSLFKTAIAEFQRQGGETTGYFLIDLPVEKWAMAFAPDLLRYGELANNDEESFSNWIVDDSSLPVTYVLDCISTQLVQWFVERREEQRQWTGALTPKMEEMWNALESLSSSWRISSTTIEGVFEVLSSPSCTVDFNRRTCTCYQWQITGFPCCHAVGCINQARWNIREFVDAYFLNDSYGLIYESSIEAIPTAEKSKYMDLKTAPCILPPAFLNKDPGRPSKKGKKRKRSRDKEDTLSNDKEDQDTLSKDKEDTPPKDKEERKKFRCGRCGQVGKHHHWVTCADASQ